jgi:hypothetical protein
MEPAQIRKPMRIQRKRTRGWKMPANAVYVGRPTRWGNPFAVDSLRGILSVTRAVEAFESMLRESERDQYPVDADIREGLRGKDLACWCRLDQRCHADTLLEIANSE